MTILTKRTVCILSASPFQQELLHSWFDKWSRQITITSLTPDVKSTLEAWDVEGPEEAFSELPDDVMGKKYKKVLQDELHIACVN
ncbi:MAG TPA: hypothetical protein EYG18_11110 [Micavibrio sp.]|nr:hypothetical protein [Pseudomonadota bacterium]MEC8665590.1 hypothetical protein [Pseudomonadota bacterium]HIF26168.1 hypothetical protein [Micavibrio sp.]HIL29807.1 hypothetical protein [Micavibrio sp.]